MMKLALGGGGDREDSRLLDEAFANWIGAQGYLLYLPVALRGLIPFAECEMWFRETFAPLGVRRIEMWTELQGKVVADLDVFDGIYIGGGNTYGLLAELRAAGLDQAICAFAQSGRPIYGGSAGAAILGSDIETIAHIDHNEVGLTDMTGLNLVGGYAVWVHFSEQDDSRIRAFVERRRTAVIAIPERSGVITDADRVMTVGFETSFYFDQLGDKVAIPMEELE